MKVDLVLNEKNRLLVSEMDGEDCGLCTKDGDGSLQRWCSEGGKTQRTMLKEVLDAPFKKDGPKAIDQLIATRNRPRAQKHVIEHAADEWLYQMDQAGIDLDESSDEQLRAIAVRVIRCRLRAALCDRKAPKRKKKTSK